MMSREEAMRIAQAHMEANRHIEAAWVLTALPGAPKGVDPNQVEAMRACFYLGADFILQMIVSAEERGWTADDVAEQTVILLKELDDFILTRCVNASRKNGETAH